MISKRKVTPTQLASDSHRMETATGDNVNEFSTLRSERSIDLETSFHGPLNIYLHEKAFR